MYGADMKSAMANGYNFRSSALDSVDDAIVADNHLANVISGKLAHDSAGLGEVVKMFD